MPETILMIAPGSFFSHYGAHVRIWEEIKALQRRGHRVALTTFHNGENLPDVEIYRSWDVPWIKRTMVGSSRHRLYLDAALSWRSLRVALALRPTLIHAHLHDGALIGAVLKRLLRVPLLFDYQGSMTSEMVDHRFLNPHGRLYRPLQALERQINYQADLIVTSTYNAARLLRADPRVAARVYTVIDCVDTERFRPFDGTPAWEAQRQELRAQLGIPAGRRLVIYLGLLAPYQGTNLLIEAAASVCQRVPDAHFLIMGYPDPQSYRAYAESLGIGTRVTLPGRIRWQDAHAYLALGDVAAAPKISATEGNGKISNYMAVGLPVVAFDTPASREILGEHGLYARPGSAADLADRLVQVLSDPALATRMAHDSRARAIADHSWDRAAAQLEELYARVRGTAHRQAIIREAP